MTTQPEVNVITIQTPDGPKQRVTVNSGQDVLFTGEIPREAISSVVQALLSATSDAARDEKPPTPFCHPLVDDQCVPPNAYLILPTDNPNYFRLSFAFGAAELHIALKRRHLRMFASEFADLADELGVELDSDDTVITDEPSEEENPIRVTSAVLPDGRQFMLMIHEGDELLADMSLPARAITPLAARLLDVAVSCARRNPPAQSPWPDGFDEDLCIRASGLAVAKTEMPDAFGLSIAFGATPIHVVLDRKDLPVIGTGLLKMAAALGIKSEAQAPPTSRTSSSWLARLWQRGSADA